MSEDRRPAATRAARAERWALCPLVALLPSARAAACSGEGAAETIARSSEVAMLCLVVSLFGLVAAFALPRRVVRTGVVVAFAGVLFHPFFWISARHGDCGLLVRDASLVFTPLMLLIVAALAWRGRSARAPQPAGP